jgi:hypothetical protein
MAIGFIFEFPGFTAEAYDAVMNTLESTNWPAPGNISHMAGPMEGGWRVVDLWESQESFDTFLQTTLGPAFQANNVQGQPKITAMEVHNHFIP